MPVVAGHPTVVRTPSGDLRGDTEGGVGVWRGVPYAEQPVGPRRFQAPGPLKPWSQLGQATDRPGIRLVSKRMKQTGHSSCCVTIGADLHPR